MKKRIKFQGFLMFLALVLSLLLSKGLFPHWKKEALDEFLDTLGIGIVLFGFLFRIAARGLKEEKSFSNKKLATDGLYSLVRHPMYFGTLLIGLGIIMVLYKWWVFLLFACIFLLIYIPQTNREEKQLYKRFGEEYKDYCRKTPKYFPHPMDLFKTDPRNYLFFKWPWIKKELFSSIVVFSVIIAIEIWEDVGLFGYSEYRKELIEICLIIAFFLLFFNMFYKKGNAP